MNDSFNESSRVHGRNNAQNRDFSEKVRSILSTVFHGVPWSNGRLVFEATRRREAAPHSSPFYILLDQATRRREAAHSVLVQDKKSGKKNADPVLGAWIFAY